MNFNMKQLMQQAQAMQKKVMDAKEKLGEIEQEGQAGGGMVKVRLNGKGEMTAISIDPSLLKADDKEILEDLLKVAHNDAKKKTDDAMEDSMAKLTGGLGLPPGFKMPF